MPKNLKACFSHKSDDWRTPSKLYDSYVTECGYFDPCPYQCIEFDGLSIDWPRNVFCNPPYSQIDKWIDKAIVEHQKQYDSDIVLLVPARTDTKWFKRLMHYASEVCFITGRLHFNDGNPAPFPSLLVQLYYCREDCKCFCVNQEGNYE